jgi:hypothetical protein
MLGGTIQEPLYTISLFSLLTDLLKKTPTLASVSSETCLDSAGRKTKEGQ